MHKFAKESTVVLLVGLMVFIPFQVAADPANALIESTPNIESMLVDLFFARPLGLVVTVVGTAAFIVSLPFSALGGNTRIAYQKMVEDPGRFTFKRPLGQFEKDAL